MSENETILNEAPAEEKDDRIFPEEGVPAFTEPVTADGPTVASVVTEQPVEDTEVPPNESQKPETASAEAPAKRNRKLRKTTAKKEPDQEPAPAAAPRSQVSKSIATQPAANAPTSNIERFVNATERVENWSAENDDRTTLSIFISAMKEKRILDGKVAGVESDNQSAYWVLFVGPVTVRIRFDNSYMTVPADLVGKRDQDTIYRQRQMLLRASGAQINFTVISLETDPNGGYIVYGSRTTAMSRIRRQYFGPTATEPITVGTDVIAQIISHGDHVAYLSFCGLDVRVNKRNLSYQYIQTIKSNFCVGEKIRVRILSIKDGDNEIPTVEVSAKPIEKERYDRNLSRVRRNGSYIGTVVNCSEREGPDGASVTISLFLDDLQVPAFSRVSILSLGNTIQQGDKVNFLALGVNEDGFAHGKILEVIKPRK